MNYCSKVGSETCKTFGGQPRRSRIKQSGQAIVEGTVMLSLMILVAIALIFFVSDIGIRMTYQQEISYIASQVASYYVTQSTGWDYQISNPSGVDVNGFAQALAGAMGLPKNDIAATVSITGGISTVTVTGTNLPLLQGSSLLPGMISVAAKCATSTAIYPRPTGLLSINVSTGGSPHTGNTVLVPCYAGCFPGDVVSTDPYSPNIPGPGTYDQFSFSVSDTTGAALSYTPGSRGSNP